MADADVAPGGRGRAVFRVMFACAALTAAVVLVFFAIGVSDGSVSSFNIGIWTVVLAALAGVFTAARMLAARGRHGLAAVVLAIVGAPGLLYAAFVLMLLIVQPRWN